MENFHQGPSFPKYNSAVLRRGGNGGKCRICLLPGRIFETLALLCVLAMIVSTTQAQTFQYSRGWTNGKRSGPIISSPGNAMDWEGTDPLDFIIPLQGRYQMSLNNPNARLRPDSQYVVKRSASVGPSGHSLSGKPLWFGGTVLDSSLDSSQRNANENGNANP